MTDTEWKCAGCGAASPDRVRVCSCPTSVVYKPNGPQAWKVGEEYEPPHIEMERLRRIAGLARKFISESDADLAVNHADPAGAYAELKAALYPDPAGNSSNG